MYNWFRKIIGAWLLRFAPCPTCHHTAGNERFWGGEMLGEVVIPCSMCDGVGTYAAYEAYEARRRADIEAINRPVLSSGDY
jgi:hypothetical protein